MENNRPICDCGNIAHNAGRDKKGNTIWRRRRGGGYLCVECHRARTPGMKTHYLIKRKTYCENIDGRLGFKCTTTIISPALLQVDHIVESRGRLKNADDDDNLQTFCACCHIYKSQLVKNWQYDKIEYMLKVIAKTRKWKSGKSEKVLKNIFSFQKEKYKELGWKKAGVK